jgi:hypothetical protein
VVHDETPVLQAGFGLLVQTTPETQATQVPVLLQTWPEPQGVPGLALVLSTQRVLPVLQSVTPVLQGAPVLLVQA